MLRATEAWIGRHAADDKYVELDCELAVALASATEGAARSTVQKVTQVEPGGIEAWQALVDGCAPKSLNDPGIGLQTILATPKRCKEKLSEWSLKVAEYEHQSRVIDEAQKTSGVEK